MRTSRPLDSVYLSTSVPPTLACLNTSDSEAYLARIGLPKDSVVEPPSLDLLSRILMAHHLSVPYDSSAIHVGSDEWRRGKDKGEPIEWRRGPGMELGRGNFQRVILKRQGGYCYALGTLAASLLRGTPLSPGRSFPDLPLSSRPLTWTRACRLWFPRERGRRASLPSARQGPGRSWVQLVVADDPHVRHCRLGRLGRQVVLRFW